MSIDTEMAEQIVKLNEENAQLKQQLAEKDELIKQLGEANKFLSSDKAVSTEQVKQIAREAQLKVMKENIEIIYSTIRHEICEKIMFILGKEYFKYCSVVSYDFIKRVLERVEKGE